MIHKNTLKSYAPDARREFIKVVTERAAFYGITEEKIYPCEIKGDFALISGRPFPKSIDKKRNDLILRLEKAGFSQTMEEIAYTWFNRFVAIRFMEVNGYLSHGYRVLSNPEKGHSEPEILEKAQFIEKLDGLGKDEIIKLKTAIGKESELYRKLLIAQCNDLSDAMPFLFERVDDPTELLLPDNLLNTDSVVRKMAGSIPEEDWKEVEIVGWLYQFYITEKKDELMKAKKAYKTEEIPAVTQLFTPNWIVKYLVQNSLGAKWLSTYSKSPLKEKMKYYIPPAEQSEEVRVKIKEITPESLNPEELTVMDPACGSGHILVEAYDLLKEIYLERGYRTRDIAGFILTKNLFGLEIDERAAQLAGFALLMKAYADDREIFKKGIKPNIICLNESNKIKIGDICRNIESAYTGKLSNFTKDKFAFMDGIDTPLFAKIKTGNEKNQEQDEVLKYIRILLELFQDAKTFGSLIRIPDELSKKLPELLQQLQKKSEIEDWMVKSAIGEVIPFVRQAGILSKRYDCVIANPPYMGSKGMNANLKEFILNNYSDGKQDLYACFMIKNLEFSKKGGFVGMITIPNWMFLSSFENIRKKCITESTIHSLIHNGRGVWGSDFGSCSFIIKNEADPSKRGIYYRLFKKQGEVSSNDELERNFFNGLDFPHYQASSDDLKKITGFPIAYWASEKIRDAFSIFPASGEIAQGKFGMSAADTEAILYWHEVPFSRIKFDAHRSLEFNNVTPFAPYDKGGEFRRWYGNRVHIINWANDGERIRKNGRSAVRNADFFCKEHVSWTLVTSGKFSARQFDSGFLLDTASNAIYFNDKDRLFHHLGALNSKVIEIITDMLNPTVNFSCGVVDKIPIAELTGNKAINSIENIKACVEISKKDWDLCEFSWDFSKLSILQSKDKCLVSTFKEYRLECQKMANKLKEHEEDNNNLFIEAYGLQTELTPDVPIEEITLSANLKYRYRGELTDVELEARFKADTMKELISYAVGCTMGRYSLDVQGIVYAHAENKDFDPKKYKIFAADEDGIVPITEREWFDDDAASRFFRFIETAWDKKGLDENLDFIADAIGRKSGESSRDGIRKYFVNDFYKDHCQAYKNRPIYWLFTSGKEKTFQALVYLHRYNEGTLARMRTEYVLPLQTKIMRHIEHLEKDKDVASGAAANKIQKEIADLRKQQAELSKFDERLRYCADMRIKLDLDDGVKANYGKFVELLEPIKGLKHGSEED